MRIFKFIMFFSVFTLVFNGCSVGGQQEKLNQNITDATQLKLGDIQTQWSQDANTDKVQAGWVGSFNEPLLSSLVLEAQKNNHELAIAVKNVDRARALADTARARLLPQINVMTGGGRAGTMSTSSSSGIILNTQVSWEADVWGRLTAGRQAAILSKQAVEADLRAAQNLLAAVVSRTYFTAIEAKLQLTVAQESVDLLSKTERIVKKRYQHGMGQAKDVALAKSDLATARESVINIKGSYRDALRALELLLGRYPAADLQINNNLPAVPAPPPAGLPSQLLERRPDIVAAERNVASVFYMTEQAQTAKLPTIGLTGTLGSASSSLSSLFNLNKAMWEIGASLLVPIYDGGTRRSAVEISTAEQKQALAVYAQTVLKAFNEVESNLDQGVIITKRIAELKTAYKEAKSALKIANIRYSEGEEDLLSVLVIQRRVVSANVTLLRVKKLLLEQRVNLNLALGGSW